MEDHWKPEPQMNSFTHSEEAWQKCLQCPEFGICPEAGTVEALECQARHRAALRQPLPEELRGFLA
jgi:hypothetical protein